VALLLTTVEIFLNRLVVLGLTLIGVACLCCCAGAADLKVTLDAPALGASSDTVTALDEPSTNAAKTANKTPTKKADPPKTSEVKVGRVAKVLADTAQIHRSCSSKSRVYCRVKTGTPLAVIKEAGDWCGVLMVNGTVGWVKSSFLGFTDYDLVAPESELKRGQTASRGGMPFRGELVDSSIIREAMSYRGVPYVYGGVDPYSGMDCSAFVRSVFRKYGMELPRTAREQALVGADVRPDDLKPGDRLYFACRNPYIDHCGIYAGNGYFIHCSAGRGGVGFDNLASDFFWKSLAAIKR
jgi:cell wall-associated NlpC family hydrolase